MMTIIMSCIYFETPCIYQPLRTKRMRCKCDNTPSVPVTQLLRNNSVLAGDLSSGSDRDITHFLRHKKYNRGSGRKRTKNKRTIWALGQLEYKKVGSVTLYFLCICRLTLTCILREISTKPRGMLTHLDWSSLIAPGPYLMPTGLFRCPLSTAFSAFLFPTLWLAFLCPLPVEISSSSLCFASRQNKQKDRLLGAPPS